MKVPEIVVRRPKFEISGDLPNHWANGHMLETHFGNAFHATIPAGERYIIRTIVKLKNRIPPELLGTAKSFMAQEGQHASAHDSFAKVLHSRGYDVGRLNRLHDRLYLWFDRVLPAVFNLSVASAAEHYTALFGDAFLARREALVGIDPEMKRLLLWHAAEEVEHKSVVFDLLGAVHPGYGLRALGFIFGTTVIGASFLFSIVSLIGDDREAGFSRALKEFLRGFRHFPLLGVLSRTLEYLRPGFHPSQRGDASLAYRFLDTMG